MDCTKPIGKNNPSSCNWIEKPKVDIGGTCYNNSECLNGICDTTGDYGCENKCLRDKSIIDKYKPAAYNCPSGFQELDKYYNDQLTVSNNKIMNASKESNTAKKKLEKKITNYRSEFYNNIYNNINNRK